MTLYMEIKPLMENIKNPTIKKFILAAFHLLSFEREILTLKFDKNTKSPIASPLALFFAFAPETLCKQLLEMGDGVVAEIATPIPSAAGFYSVFAHASKESRLALSQWVVNLSAEQIFLLFSKMPNVWTRLSSYTYAIQIFEIAEPETQSFLIQGLVKLRDNNPTQFLSVFQNNFPLIELAKKLRGASRNETMLALLQLVEELPKKQRPLVLYGQTVSIQGQVTTDNLLRYMHRFSKEVILQALKLLSAAPFDMLVSCLFTDTGNAETPQPALAMAFSYDKEEARDIIASAFIDLLNQNETSRTLLGHFQAPEKPLASSEPFLYLLAKHNRLAAIAHYLQQTELPIFYHRGIAENPQVEAIFKARPLYFYLKGKNRDYTFDFFVDQVKQYPSVLSVRWDEDETLAHIAVLEKKPEALHVLIQAGADLRVKTKQQQNVLDLAIRLGHQESLKLLITAATELLPLPYLLDKVNYDIVVDLIRHLRNQANQTTTRSFATAFKELPKARQIKTPDLNQSLPGKTLSERLQPYCDAEQDRLTFFLLQAGEVLADLEPTEEVLDFISAHLADKSKWMSLVLFLFAMPAEAMVKFLQALKTQRQGSTAIGTASLVQYSGDPSLRIGMTLLDSFLSHALVQESVFAFRTLEEHQTFHKAFSEAGREAALENIAAVYFASAPFRVLPAKLIENFAQEMSDEVLYEHYRQHSEPALLTLILSRPTLEHFIKTALKVLLQTKLDLFDDNEQALPEADLFDLLNFATGDAPKAIIFNFLQTKAEDSSIQLTIDKLFRAFRKEQSLQPASVLYALFYTRALNLCFLEQSEDQNYLVDFLTISALGTVEELLRAHQSTQATTEANILRLNTSFTEAIKARQDKQTLWPVLFSWQLSRGHLLPIDAMLEQIPLLNQTAKAAISQEIDKTLQLFEQSAQLIARLSRNFADHEQILSDADDNTLTALRALSEQAQASALKEAVDSELQEEPYSLTSKDLELLNHFIGSLLSFKALLLGLYDSEADNLTCLHTFIKFIQKHPTALQLNALSAWIQSYVPRLEEDNFSELAQYFVLALGTIIEQASFERQEAIIASFQKPMLDLLLPHVLSGCSSDDEERKLCCKALLTCLCQQDSQHLDLIKTYVNRKDLELLGAGVLKQIATDVLTSKNTLEEATYDWVWIARLILFPGFLANAPSEIIAAFMQHHGDLSLGFVREKYEETARMFAGKLRFGQQHSEAFSRWEKAYLEKSETRQRLAHKLVQLRRFRSIDSKRALLMQAEENCFEMRATSPQLADQALENLYAYHNQHLANMPKGILFRMAEVLYKKVLPEGDLAVEGSPFFSYLKAHLPQQTFQQEELSRKRDAFDGLYNEHRQKIGFLNESNYAFALRDDIPVPLLEIDGFAEGFVFYDRNLQRIGTLTANGQCKFENIFQSKSSAYLVRSMPTDQLQGSDTGLDLLFKDIFLEHSLDTLLDLPADPAKKAWLQEEVLKRLQETKDLVSKELCLQVVSHFPIENLLILLAKAKHKPNAECLFQTILQDNDKRKLLFKNARDPSLAKFFVKIGGKALLADYLVDSVGKPWFSDGLVLFTRKTPDATDILNPALQILTERVLNNTLAESTFHSIVSSFLKTEKVAKIILEGFLGDSATEDIPSWQARHAFAIAQHFSKEDLIEALKTLNEKATWHNSAQYRFILAILYQEHNQLFLQKEPRLSKKLAWSEEELGILVTFIERHSRTRQNHDPQDLILEAFLSRLVISSANSAKTQLFYQKERLLNEKITGMSLKRSLLDTFAARYYLLGLGKKAIQPLYEKLLALFGSNHSEYDSIIKSLELEDASLVTDWKKLCQDTWANTKGQTLPVISAFLLNYASPETVKLEELLGDILKNKTLMKDKTLLHAITGLMAAYPKRDVSHVIFKVLENHFTQENASGNQHLQKLDKTIFKHMATFYSSTRRDLSCPPKQALLAHFGQQKHYALTQHCARVLIKPMSWSEFFAKPFKRGFKKAKEELLRQVQKEASVEILLKKWENWFFFRFLCWFYRSNEQSGLVKLFNDTTPYPYVFTMPERVSTTTRSGTAFTALHNYQSKQKKIRETCDKLKSEIKQEVPYSAAGINKVGLHALKPSGKVEGTRQFAPQP